jgi:hypothetical protein
MKSSCLFVDIASSRLGWDFMRHVKKQKNVNNLTFPCGFENCNATFIRNNSIKSFMFKF